MRANKSVVFCLFGIILFIGAEAASAQVCAPQCSQYSAACSSGQSCNEAAYYQYLACMNSAFNYCRWKEISLPPCLSSSATFVVCVNLCDLEEYDHNCRSISNAHLNQCLRNAASFSCSAYEQCCAQAAGNSGGGGGGGGNGTTTTPPTTTTPTPATNEPAPGWNVVNGTVTAQQAADNLHFGKPKPNLCVGEPVNLSTGNTYLHHADYELGGLSSELSIIRTYNSQSRHNGLFGVGWSTGFEELLTVIDGTTISVSFDDGKAVYFGRIGNTSTYNAYLPPDDRSKLVKLKQYLYPDAENGRAARLWRKRQNAVQNGQE